MLDPIFLNTSKEYRTSGVMNVDHLTDHHMVFCEFYLQVHKFKPKLVTYRDFKNFDAVGFHRDLQYVPWHHILRITEIKNKIEFLTQNVLYLFDIHAPLRNARITKQNAPWLTPNLRLIMKERNKALSNHKKLKTLQSWTIYREIRNFTKSAIRKEKAAYLNYLNNRDATQFYRALKNLNIQHGKPVIDIPPDLSDPNHINRYFTSIFENSDVACAERISFYSNHKFNENLSFNFKLIDVPEIIKIINSIKSNAKGSDGLSLQMVKMCLPSIDKYICHIINSCLEIGFFPQIWKEALVIPLPKTANPSRYDDLRPISLLPILSKILEKIVYSQIINYLNDANLLPKEQSGFRKGQSTETLLLALSDDVFRACDNGLATVLVLLDFSKAFDTVNHALLVEKCKYIGFDNVSAIFF